VFDGFIAGLGSTSGIRLVVGIWPRSPLGSFFDVMVETAAGHRVLLAPSRQVADFVSATYEFDEVRVEPIRLHRDQQQVRVEGPSVRLRFRIGSRPLVGNALSAVPSRLARARWWSAALDPIVSRVLPGVRTRGAAGNGREEFYAALDMHRISSLHGRFDGHELGDLAPVLPPVRFGFGSTPAQPAIVRVVTTVAEAG
jgi:hypothetical protein